MKKLTISSNFSINKRASRLEDTLCPPEAPFGFLWLPSFSYMGDNISKYVCLSLTVIIDITRKITKFVNF